VTYRFRLLLAVLALGVGADGFAQARRAVPVSVAINEIMASNRQTLADPQGEFDDWIELYNKGSAPVDVGGCYLTDNLSDPTQWQIPANTPTATTIAAHGYLLSGPTARLPAPACTRLRAQQRRRGSRPFAADARR
jgi:hypothetical protein